MSLPIHHHRQLRKLSVWMWRRANNQLKNKSFHKLSKARPEGVQDSLTSSILIPLLLEFQKKNMKIIDILKLISPLEPAKNLFPRLTKMMQKHPRKTETKLPPKMLLWELPQKDIKTQSRQSLTSSASLTKQEPILSMLRGQLRNTSENTMQL